MMAVKNTINSPPNIPTTVAQTELKPLLSKNPVMSAHLKKNSAALVNGSSILSSKKSITFYLLFYFFADPGLFFGDVFTKLVKYICA